MADFDGNPFADPEVNPFADPAVQEATAPVKDGQEEYNPFSEEAKEKDPEPPRLPPPPTKVQVKEKKKDKGAPKSKKKPEAPVRPKEMEPAIMTPQNEEPPPTYTPAPSTFADPESSELKKREEEIARREKALQDREKNLERLGAGERPNNFPPFPKFCPAPLKPCFYINIKVEVPPSEHWKVYTLLALLIYTWVLLVINVLVAIIGASADSRSDNLVTMGVAVLYLVLFVPGTLFCWFLPLYQAYKRDSSLSFMWFFFVMLFQVLSYILNGIGIPNLGACGFFNGARFFDKHNGIGDAAGALFMIIGGAWFLGAPLAVLVIIMVHRYYRASGKTINQAVEEGVTGAAKNKHVRSAVKSGVSAGVSAGTSHAFDKN